MSINNKKRVLETLTENNLNSNNENKQNENKLKKIKLIKNNENKNNLKNENENNEINENNIEEINKEKNENIQETLTNLTTVEIPSTSSDSTTSGSNNSTSSTTETIINSENVVEIDLTITPSLTVNIEPAVTPIITPTATTNATTTTEIGESPLISSVNLDTFSQAETTQENMTQIDRPYMNCSIDNIDAMNADNVYLCALYVSSMYVNFWKIETKWKIDPNYMERQPFINDKMRAILIDWLVEVHSKFRMTSETLYLTVNLIDRYLEKQEVRRSKLQLVGVCALLLAAKYEETRPPEVRDLVFITDRAYTAREIIEMEAAMMVVLDFNLTIPTIYTFLCRYLKAAHADKTMVQMSCYLAERSLQEYSTLKYPPSLIAAKVIHAARMSLRRHPWSPTLVHYTRYDEPDLVECGNEMREYLAANTQQTAVARKYSGPKFGGVARMPIAI